MDNTSTSSNEQDGEGTAARVAYLGHVGIHVRDLDASKRFYVDMLGLRVTDEDDRLGMVFLSSRPTEEHHELLLCRGRDTSEAKVIQQISFGVDSLVDLKAIHARLRAAGVRFQKIVSHGNAIGVYFYDPDGNVCEAYWKTGFDARQPFIERIDIERELEALLADVEASADRFRRTGYVEDPAMA